MNSLQKQACCSCSVVCPASVALPRSSLPGLCICPPAAWLLRRQSVELVPACRRRWKSAAAWTRLRTRVPRSCPLHRCKTPTVDAWLHCWTDNDRQLTLPVITDLAVYVNAEMDSGCGEISTVDVLLGCWTLSTSRHHDHHRPFTIPARSHAVLTTQQQHGYDFTPFRPSSHHTPGMTSTTLRGLPGLPRIVSPSISLSLTTPHTCRHRAPPPLPRRMMTTHL